MIDVVLWKPLRARRAGFMSLFLASIGLALVLRQALLLFGSAQPRTYRVNPFRVFVIGSVRLSEAQVIARVGAPDITTGQKNAKQARWSWLPTEGDPETITTVTLVSGMVTTVERTLVKK